MKVSIVVPTLNQGPFIEVCLLSLQNQTHRDIEVIIQDSCSTDQTEQICQRFSEQDPRFRYFREKDSGQSDAINRGLLRSSGGAWTWLCSDDCFADPRALEVLVNSLVKTLESDSKVVGVYGNAQYMSEDGEVVGPYQNSTRNLTREDFKLNWPMAQPSSILLRQAVVDAGGVNKNLEFGMDLDLFLHALKGGRYFIYTPQLIVNIRLQPNSKSVKFRKKTAQNALTLIKKHFGDTGNPLESGYAREYGFAKRLELTENARRILWILVPFRKIIKAKYQKLKDLVYTYMDPYYADRSLGITIFRTFWRFLRVVKWNLINPIFIYVIPPIKRGILGLIDYLLRVKGLFVR